MLPSWETRVVFNLAIVMVANVVVCITIFLYKTCRSSQVDKKKKEWISFYIIFYTFKEPTFIITVILTLLKEINRALLNLVIKFIIKLKTVMKLILHSLPYHKILNLSWREGYLVCRTPQSCLDQGPWPCCCPWWCWVCGRWWAQCSQQTLFLLLLEQDHQFQDQQQL